MKQFCIRVHHAVCISLKEWYQRSLLSLQGVIKLISFRNILLACDTAGHFILVKWILCKNQLSSLQQGPCNHVARQFTVSHFFIWRHCTASKRHICISEFDNPDFIFSGFRNSQQEWATQRPTVPETMSAPLRVVFLQKKNAMLS